MSLDQTPSPHVLDRIIWNSLITHHAKFAIGTDLAKRYPPEVAAFAAVRDHSAAALHDLAQIVAPGEFIVIDGFQHPSDLPGWTTLEEFDVHQMLCDQPIDVPNS